MGKATRWFRSLLGGNKATEVRPAKPKNGWGFVKTLQKDQPPPKAVEVSGNEQRMRAIAVAAAMEAAAEAAVAAAKAAVAVVRLTSSGGSSGMKKEERAVVKIQAVFRGYLARKALRALKGLVKLQALVRGNIVRKQAAETLRCMKALVRAQARARAFRVLHSEPSRSSKSSHSYPGPATPENHESSIRSVASKWMEDPYWERREASKSMDDEKNAKPLLKVESAKAHYYSRHHSDHSAGSLTTAPDSLSKGSTTPTQLSTPSPSLFERHHYTSSLLRFPIEDSGESPQFHSAASHSGSSRRGPFTPTKSEFQGYCNHPNYMSKTESFMAKSRSRSAPRHRSDGEKSSSMRRLPSQEPGQPASRSSMSRGKVYPGSGRLDRLGLPVSM